MVTEFDRHGQMSGENGSAPISRQGSLKSKRKNIGGQSRNLKKKIFCQLLMNSVTVLMT